MLRNALGEDVNGRCLLRCTRAYVELDLLASFDVHADITIKQGRATAARFSKLANVSSYYTPKYATTTNLFEP